MSDFYGCLESTSFRVKDEKAWLADPVVTRMRAKNTDSGFMESTDGVWWAFGWYDHYPSPVLTEWDDARGADVEYDVLEAVQRHILPGDVCQISVSGNEGLRYIGGFVWFVTSKGVAAFDASTEWDVQLRPRSLRRVLKKFVAEAERIL